MYVILVNEDNTLSTSKRERIMQRSKLVDNLWFLVNPDYKGIDMTNCTVVMEYLLPVSKKYSTEILVKSPEGYKDHLKYVLPFDTNLTSEAGEIEVQLSFYNVDISADGNPYQLVRKTSPTQVNIIPISAWSDIIPDSALTALDQRVIKMDAQIKALNDIAGTMQDKQVDDLSYNEDTNELQLMAGKTEIGKKVKLKDCSPDEEGVPVVDFSKYAGDYDDEEEGLENASDVVEF